MIQIRKEQADDMPFVHKLNVLEFEPQAEADLVDILCANARPVISLVAVDDDAVVGHILVSILAALLFALIPIVATADSFVDDAIPYIYVLGVAQDAGYPQANCYRPHCMRAWKDPTLKRLTSSIAVVDSAHGAKYLIDATPDIREQLYRLHIEAPDDSHDLGGVFLTHGHMGHYTGLMHFGREAVGADGIRVFTMPRMHDYLSNNGPWSQLVSLGNIDLILILAGSQINLSDDLSVVPLQVPHRDEFTETVGYRINGPNKSALFIPDIDKWGKWDTDIRELVKEVDYALLDGSFFCRWRAARTRYERDTAPVCSGEYRIVRGATGVGQGKNHIHSLQSHESLVDRRK